MKLPSESLVAALLIAIAELGLDQESFNTEEEKEVKQAWFNLWQQMGKPSREQLDDMTEGDER